MGVLLQVNRLLSSVQHSVDRRGLLSASLTETCRLYILILSSCLLSVLSRLPLVSPRPPPWHFFIFLFSFFRLILSPLSPQCLLLCLSSASLHISPLHRRLPRLPSVFNLTLPSYPLIFKLEIASATSLIPCSRLLRLSVFPLCVYSLHFNFLLQLQSFVLLEKSSALSSLYQNYCVGSLLLFVSRTTGTEVITTSRAATSIQ